jgi:hypothetical protein
LFLFLPFLAQLPFDRVIRQAGLPGSQSIPAPHAVRSLLALKLFGSARHSHVMSSVLDEGLALFAGLNVIPKRSFLTEYSCRIDPDCYPKMTRLWFEAMRQLGLRHGSSFDLDFHTIPFRGQVLLLSLLQSEPKLRGSTHLVIACHPGVGQQRPLLTEHFQSQFMPRAETNVLGDAGFLPAFLVLRPRPGQVQTHVHQGMLTARSITQIDADLAILDLAQTPAPQAPGSSR